MSESRARRPRPREQAAFAEHLAALRVCRLCPNVVPPPVVASPESWPRMMLVGQAPGPREVESGRPFHFTAGGRLFGWFAGLGADEEEFRSGVFIAAAIRCFPGRAPQGGDRAPALDELARCRPYLERELELLRPLTVIAVGQAAIGCFLPASAPLHERVGRTFEQVRRDWSFELIPLPHPSGRSTWTNRPGNLALLERALDHVAASAGWRATFADPRRSPA